MATKKTTKKDIEKEVSLSSVDSNPLQNMDESKESKDKIKEHEEFVEDIEKGDIKISGDKVATDLSTIKKPLVPHPLSGKPVYESQDQWMKAEAAKGNL